jgi:hypothetical protein
MKNKQYSSFGEIFCDREFRAKELICLNTGIIKLGSAITVCDPTLNITSDKDTTVEMDILPGPYYTALLIRNDSDYSCAGQIITHTAYFDDALDAFAGTWENPLQAKLKARCCITDKTTDRNSYFTSECNDITADKFGGLLMAKNGFVCVAGHEDNDYCNINIVRTCREINGLVIDFNICDLTWYMVQNADNDGEYFKKEDYFHIFSLTTAGDEVNEHPEN